MTKFLSAVVLAAAIALGGWAGVTTYHLASAPRASTTGQTFVADQSPAKARTVVKVAPCKKPAVRHGNRCVRTVVKTVHTTLTVRTPVVLPPTSVASTAYAPASRPAAPHRAHHWAEHETESGSDR